MNTAELFGWLMDTTETILRESAVVDLAEPSAHVDIADAFDESTYPFIGLVPISMTPVSGGLGNAETVATDTTTTNGTTDSVEQTLRREFTVELTPVTDDDFSLRDQLTDEMVLGFADIDTPSDIYGLSVGEQTPSGRPESLVRANGLEVGGTLHTRRERDVTPVETVDWQLTTTGETGDVPTYPDEY